MICFWRQICPVESSKQMGNECKRVKYATKMLLLLFWRMSFKSMKYTLSSAQFSHHMTATLFQLTGWENGNANIQKISFFSIRLSHPISFFSLTESLSALWENSCSTSTPWENLHAVSVICGSNRPLWIAGLKLASGCLGLQASESHCTSALFGV